jgi:2-polyprenyl-6-methoxyphenol hydroxylase-like FAD-dependent oxidoreductase
MNADGDALIIGAGPAGAATAIWLAQAGWRVVLVEKNTYPRDKVCGECIAAGNLDLLDSLGVGRAFRSLAGPELRSVAWMRGTATTMAALPRAEGSHAYGRALGRDQLDALLVARCRELGVIVRQPATVLSVGGGPGAFDCRLQDRSGMTQVLRVPIVVDAHGSWEAGPRRGAANAARLPRKPTDLFAFKARFRNATLAPGLLPVLAFPGGYGGMVLAEQGRVTLACCVRRDSVARVRRLAPGTSAGVAIESYLRSSCAGLRLALTGATRECAWLSVGPLRPGERVEATDGLFRVGNAAGESHPLIGEGISMALQSARLLAGLFATEAAAAMDAVRQREVQARYAKAWRGAFRQRLRYAAVFAHLAMRPLLAQSVGGLLGRRPQLLTVAARLAGKASRPVEFRLLHEEM